MTTEELIGKDSREGFAGQPPESPVKTRQDYGRELDEYLVRAREIRQYDAGTQRWEKMGLSVAQDETGASDSLSLAGRALAARPVPGGGARYEPVYSPKRAWITGIHLRRITALQSQRRLGWLDWEFPSSLTRCVQRLLTQLGVSPLGESRKPGLASRTSGGGGRI